MDPSVFGLRPRSLLLRSWCALFDCSWDERPGYDWCGRCQTARWHIARQHATL